MPVPDLVDRVVSAFGEAMSRPRDAEIAQAWTCEWRLSHNRPVVLRDGTVRTHGTPTDPEALRVEGPIDPEVAVTAVRSVTGEPLGLLANFTCHPTHHGGETVLTAGWPGVLADGLKEAGWPVPLVQNGASGNIGSGCRSRESMGVGMEEMGRTLTADIAGAPNGAAFRADVSIRAAARTLPVAYREATEEQIEGTAAGAQRFIDPAIYARNIAQLVPKIRERGHTLAEVQVLQLGGFHYAGVPAEYSVEHGLRIKEQAYPRHPPVVGHANGTLGYLPTKQAFARGGYETIFAPSGRMAPEVGDPLADAAIDLIGQEG